jgi:hypothetical protein
MSYAEHIFGTKENRIEMWVQDLMLAGTASATFNSDRMLEISESVFARDNGIAGYYLLLWCKYRGINLATAFRVGQKIAVPNRDYGTVDTYVLAEIRDTFAYFVSANYMYYGVAISPNNFKYYDGIVGNTVVGAWLSAETPNWYTGIDYPFVVSSEYYSKLNQQYGYAHGVPDELKDILKQNVSQAKTFTPVLSDNPIGIIKCALENGATLKPSQTALYLLNKCGNDEGITYNRNYWSVSIPTSSTQNNAIPAAGGYFTKTDDGNAFAADITAMNAGVYVEGAPYCIQGIVLTDVFDISNTLDHTGTTNNYPSLLTKAAHLSTFKVEL